MVRVVHCAGPMQVLPLLVQSATWAKPKGSKSISFRQLSVIYNLHQLYLDGESSLTRLRGEVIEVPCVRGADR